MQFIHSGDGREGVEAMAGKITEGLKKGKVLWLLCGGSSIPLAALAMKVIRARSENLVSNLTVGLTDERYGEAGHKDSNWQQLKNAGFDFAGVQTLPVLKGKLLEETARQYATALEYAFQTHQNVVAQFGIGADGHIAGILPKSEAVESNELVCGYEAPPYTRITITPRAFSYLTAAFAFVFGAAKHDAIERLQTQNLPLTEEPCQILKMLPAAFLFTDQVA